MSTFNVVVALAAGSVVYDGKEQLLAFISPVEGGRGHGGGTFQHLQMRRVSGAAGLQATPLTFGPWTLHGLLAWDRKTSSM